MGEVHRRRLTVRRYENNDRAKRSRTNRPSSTGFYETFLLKLFDGTTKRDRDKTFFIMLNYKIGLLIFSNSKNAGPAILRLFEKLVKDEAIGVIKTVEMFDQKLSLLGPVLDVYTNTNLGMIVLVAPDADQFFPYSELEEVGQKNEKYLVTLNLDDDIENNFLEVIKKVKASPNKPRRGCDSSCR